jgi:hypothetical protein
MEATRAQWGELATCERSGRLSVYLVVDFDWNDSQEEAMMIVAEGFG